MKLRRQFAFRAVAVLGLAGGAVVAAPAVLHDQVLATSSHQTAGNPTFPLYLQLPAADTNGASSSTVDSATPVVEIQSYQFGVENPTTISSATGGSGGGSKVRFDELTLTKQIGSSTTQFLRSLSSGGRYKQIQLNVQKAGAPGQPYLTYLLGDAAVTSLQHSGSSGSPPTESIALAFGSLKLSYRAQDASGNYGPFTSECYSVETQTPVCP